MGMVRSSRLRSALYWAATGFVALETFVGGMIDLTHGRVNVVSGPRAVDIVTGLGYPVYVLAILGGWKLAGALTLVVPGFLRLKEWAYAGLVFELSGAAFSQGACGNRSDMIAPLFLLGLVAASWALRPANRVLGAGTPPPPPGVAHTTS